MRKNLLSRAGLALAVAVAGTLTVGVSPGVGATPTTDYASNFIRVESPNPQATGRWAERLATVPDLNGDGKNEILIADLSEDFGGFTNGGRVYMQDGATRNLIYNITSPQIQAAAQFGFFIAVIGDVNGDGKADFTAGTDAQDTLADGTPCTAPVTPAPLAGCNQDQGKAWVFSGANGQTLYALNNPNPQGFARFGSRIGRAGDINGDGVADVIVGASNNDLPAACGNDPTTGRTLAAASVPAGCRANEGEAFIFSGVNGALLRTLNVPASDRAPGCNGSGAAPCGNFGLAVQGFGDATGDGVVDQLVNASVFNFDTATNGPCANLTVPSCNRGQGAEYVFNGATGALVRRTDDPAPQAGATWGFQDAEPLAPGDVNGDGAADYYGQGFQQNGPAGQDTWGRAWVFSGRTGAVLYEVKDPTPADGGQFGWSLTKTDYNKDGTPDLYVGQSPHHVPGGAGTTVDQSGGTYIFNGKDGSLLKALELPASDAQSGTASNNNGSNLGWAMAAPGDLNGDGEPDYVASGPFTDVGPSAFNCQAPAVGCVQDVGREFVFYSKVPAKSGPGPGPSPAPTPPVSPFTGCPNLTANVIRGTAASESLNGTPGADRIFAGTGNDRVDGLAGNDCIDLGLGNDVGQGGLGGDLLLGGRGSDRVSGSSGNDRLLGGAGTDRLNGGFGNDALHGQSGGDRIAGSRGRDRINGGSSNDVISAGSGNDRVAGDQGNDRISGNSGNDLLTGNSGNDRIDGSIGADRISGGSGSDRINSRDGRRDRVNCGSGRDRVVADRFDVIARNCERVRRS